MSDRRLRELERAFLEGDHDAGQALTRELVRLAGRDPRREPAPGDVVLALAGDARWSAIARRVVACAAHKEATVGRCRCERAAGPAWCQMCCRANWCGRSVHWLRQQGRGHRFGVLRIKSWRAWARDGVVLEVA